MVLAANGWWLWTILAVAVWIAIAFWPARVAARKGHSFFLYFLFSLVFFPLALLVAYMVDDRRLAAAHPGDAGAGDRRSRQVHDTRIVRGRPAARAGP